MACSQPYFVLAVGGDLNGPTICGIFTIVGFSSTGKHLRNIAPIMLGVYSCQLLRRHGRFISHPPMLALLFSTTLAPVAGVRAVAGIIAGFLHSVRGR
ncbi:MAG: DUF1576 domain-containing protein [Enterocloster bolteae]